MFSLRKRPNVIADRFTGVFAAHNIEANQIPRLLPSIQYKDLQSPKTLLPRPKQPGNEQANPNKNHKTGPKNEKIPIDRKQRLYMDNSQLLPSDAVFKGYREVVVQNLILKRDNVLYEVAQFYSKSENKYYSASLPPGYCGEFGAEL